MIRVFKIVLFILFFIPFSGVGQSKYCIYEHRSYKAYEDKNFLKAKELMDSALTMCPDLAKSPQVWHAMGFYGYEIYRNIDKKDSGSKAREWSLEALKKSMELDTIEYKYDSTNRKVIATIAKSYWNDLVGLMDTNNFDKAYLFFEKYIKIYSFAYPEHSLKQRRIQFNEGLGRIYKEKYENNTKKNRKYINLSIDAYKYILELDSLNYSANHNIGIIYHNLGVNLILADLDVEEDILLMMEYIDRSVEYFTNALPFLKRAYELNPENPIVVRGMAAVYLSLHDTEKHMLYMNVLNELEKEEKNSIQPNND